MCVHVQAHIVAVITHLCTGMPSDTYFIPDLASHTSPAIISSPHLSFPCPSPHLHLISTSALQHIYQPISHHQIIVSFVAMFLCFEPPAPACNCL